MTAQVGKRARLAVRSRGAGYCEAGIRPVCTRRAEAVHHRRPRGAGGTWRRELNEPGNLLDLCTACHLHIESHRAWALARGLLLVESETPSETPVRLCHLYGEAWFLLGDDGILAWVEDDCTASLDSRLGQAVH